MAVGQVSERMGAYYNLTEHSIICLNNSLELMHVMTALLGCPLDMHILCRHNLNRQLLA